MRLVFSLVAVLALTACSNSDKPETANLKIPVVIKTTRETYMNGEKFCANYSKYTSREYPVRVSVPRDYNDPSKGSVSIYAYTLSPFDSSKPSYVYLDGGPGQNSHGIMPEYTGGKFNEIRFDQRGLGCSAPATYDEYMDASLYSTENTVRDMEAIREAYGIQKWTVYGISYGTVPSTMYASLYPSRVTSAVLEGVAGKPGTLHIASYKASKLNLVLRELTTTERVGFLRLLETDSKNEFVFFGWVFQQFYVDEGMQAVVAGIRALTTSDGGVNVDRYNTFRDRMRAYEARFPNEQQPGAVDGHVLAVVYCKSLDGAHRSSEYVTYNENEGFVVRSDANSNSEQECRKAGVAAHDEKPYFPKDFKTSVPVVYFQGAHDGATTAKGAMAHFQSVPQGPTYFLLAQRGGHNPNVSRLESEDSIVKSEEAALFLKALSATPIAASDFALTNARLPNQKWILYTSPYSVSDMPSYFEGIRRSLSKF